MQRSAQYIDVYLAPLAGLLARGDVTDVMINRPGEAWIETLGGAIERIDCPSSTPRGCGTWRGRSRL